VSAQERPGNSYINLPLLSFRTISPKNQNNKWVQAAIGKCAAGEDRKDAYDAVLPTH